MARMSKYSIAFKTKVVLETVKEQESMKSISRRFEIAPSKVMERIEAYGVQRL
jgi:transposase-like protein